VIEHKNRNIESQELINWFVSTPVHNPYAVTLTLKQRTEVNTFKGRFGSSIDREKVSTNLRYFMNRLNQSVYGKGFLRYGKRLSVIPVVEGNDSIRIHVHLVLECPTHINRETFESLVRECWLKTNFGHKNIDLKPVHDYRGWVNYILKNKSKIDGVQSSVDLENVFLH